MKELILNHKYRSDGRVYEVRKAIDKKTSCKGCTFFDDGVCLDSYFGDCSKFYRSDKKDVIFVDVGEIDGVACDDIIEL